MNLPQREHPQAAAELDAAVCWYEDREAGIGLTLVERTRQARDMIAQWPDAAPLFVTASDGSVIRSKSIRGFPYRVIYSVQTDEIVILAYAHEHRKPGYWLPRLEG